MIKQVNSITRARYLKGADVMSILLDEANKSALQSHDSTIQVVCRFVIDFDEALGKFKKTAQVSHTTIDRFWESSQGSRVQITFPAPVSNLLM